MKKLLTLLLVAVMVCTSLVACKQPTPPVDEVTYDLDSAVAYVESLYQEDLSVTAVDYPVVSQVMVAGVTYQVDWSVDSDKVTVGEPANGTVTIGVDEKSPEEVSYKLTATVKAGDGTSKTVVFNLTVPKYEVNSHAEYMAAKQDDMLTVEGIVVAINSKEVGNKYNHLFLADTSVTGGYYCYSVTQDPIKDLGIEVGMTVSVTGPMAPYSGMQEIKGGQVAIIDKTIKQVAPVDITEAFAAGSDLGAYVGLPVVIKGVEIGAQELEKDTSQYLFFSIGEKQGYVRTYVTDFPTTLKADDKAGIDADHAAHFGYKADATGILILYNSAPYLIPMTTTPFTNYEEVVKTPAEKVAAEKDGLTLGEVITEDTTLTLPLVGTYYNDVTIAWAIDNTAYTIGADGKLAIVLGEEDVTLTLTATITCEGTTETKTFTMRVNSASTDLYLPVKVENAVADTAYKFVLTQNKLGGANLYFAGYMSGNYLATTDKADKAVDVKLEAVEGGFRMSFMDGETKKYIDIYEYTAGKAGVQLTETPTCVYTYNAELGIWVANVAGADYYLGTYNTFNTISASKTSYINAENKGVSQFPCDMATLVPAVYVAEKAEAVADGTYKFVLTQNKLGGVNLYFAGYMSGNYLATTDKADKAVDVKLEAVEGGFRMSFMDGETKKYIDIYEYTAGKAGVQLTETPTCVYNYNAELGIWVANVAGADYYLGTYNTFNTISASKTSYINAENKGVSQFPCDMVTLKLAEVAPVEVAAPEVNTAYKFVLTQNKLGGANLYFAGYMSGNYLATTEKISKATDVFVETVEGGTRFYFMDGETKKYVDVYEYTAGKAGVQLTETPTCVYNYNAELGIWVANVAGADYYLGTYNTFNTISASKTSYINAENKGVSQFPCIFATIEVVK